ncbi:MAG TPA: hypothetical protein VFE57_12725, partial [Cyclobacteriaceae bacterium]|nr:hypothetical protein [Cyclobacteriaceae bacterium]
MIIVLAGLHVVILFLTAYFVWRVQDVSIRTFFWPAMLVKLTAGILLGLMYQHYYSGGDTFIFFQDSKQLSNLFRTDLSAYFQFLWDGDDSMAIWTSLSEIQPRSLFFTKMISVINVLTFDNYWISGLYLSLISFFSSWYLFRKISALFPDAKRAAALALLFFPTVVFWSSGMIKESLAVASLFFLTGLFLTMISKTKPSPMEWILFPVCVWVLWMLKYYWAVVFIPAAVTTLLVHSFMPGTTKPFTVQILLWLILFVVICSGTMLVHPNFYPEYFLQVIVDNNVAFGTMSEAQNLIHYDHLQATWASIILNSPWALVSGLMRPFLFEGGNAVKLLYAMEN